MADVEYFIDPPDYFLGTRKEWESYLAALQKIKQPSPIVRAAIVEAETRVSELAA